MSLRGDPSGSRDIFKSMKAKKGEGEKVTKRFDEGTVPQEEQEWSLGHEGGAAFSLKKRQMEKKLSESKEKDIKAESMTIVEKKKIRVDAESVIVENIQMHSDKKDYKGVIEGLMKLYFLGRLDEYEISGVSRAKVMNEIKRFRETVGRVIE